MKNEGRVIFEHCGVQYRECKVEECMWNINYEEMVLAEEIAGRPKPKEFEGRICNSVPDNPLSILEASKVRCYPEE